MQGFCRVRLQWNCSITLWVAGYRCVRPSATPAKTNWLTNICRTATAVNSLDEAQNSGSTEYPRTIVAQTIQFQVALQNLQGSAGRSVFSLDKSLSRSEEH